MSEKFRDAIVAASEMTQAERDQLFGCQKRDIRNEAIEECARAIEGSSANPDDKRYYAALIRALKEET